MGLGVGYGLLDNVADAYRYLMNKFGRMIASFSLGSAAVPTLHGLSPAFCMFSACSRQAMKV